MEIRVPLIETVTTREALSADQQPLWDEIVATRGSIRGPFSVLMHRPELAVRVARLGSYIRFESSLDAHTREIASLVTARVLDCEYEWAAHVAQAAESGIPDTTLDAIHRRVFDELPEHDRMICQLAEQLLERHRVTESTLAAAKHHLGLEQLVELVGTIGYFSSVSATLNAFQVVPQPGLPVDPARPFARL
jgi:4-carboxymuconolactone decarboxylase